LRTIILLAGVVPLSGLAPGVSASVCLPLRHCQRAKVVDGKCLRSPETQLFNSVDVRIRHCTVRLYNSDNGRILVAAASRPPPVTTV